MEEALHVGVVAGCVVSQDNKYLLVQEKKPSVYGKWNLPAGHVDVGESFEEAAVREVLEETGLTVKINSKLGVTHNSPNESVCHAYRAEVLGGELATRPEEILDAKWFTLDDIKTLDSTSSLRAPWVLESIISAAKNVQL